MLKQRVITALVLVAILLPCLLLESPWPFAVLTLVFIGAAGWEWARLNGGHGVAAVALGGVQLTGGVGSVAGVVAGVLSLGLMTNGLNLFGVSPFMRGVLTGVLLLAAVSLQRRRIVGM